MSRYIKITAGTPYCGTEEEFFQVFDDDTSDEFINEIAEENRQDQAESFEYLGRGGWDEDWESEEAKDDYYADCYAEWVEMTKEEFYKECNE